MRHIKPYQLFESNEDKLQVLRDHLDRSNVDLAKWILDNLAVQGSADTEESAIKVIKSVDSPTYYKDLPTMYFFDTPEDVSEYEWLVHFTKYPDQIVKTGFTKGTPNYLELGMSWGRVQGTAGYNYGLTVDDAVEKYGSIEKAAEHWHGTPVYFKAPAIKAYHFGDEVEEVLFWGPDAHDFTTTIPE